MLFTGLPHLHAAALFFHVRKPLCAAVDFHTFHFFDNQSLCSAFSVFFPEISKKYSYKSLYKSCKICYNTVWGILILHL